MAQSLPIGACCRACGYALAGVAEARCPECGREFNPGDPRTFDRSVRARRLRRVWRPLIIAVSTAALLYGTFPRGYVRGTLIYVPGGTEPQEKHAQWRLAPPRWLARAPYPRWTVVEKGGQYLRAPTPEDLAGQAYRTEIEIYRCRWLEQESRVGALSRTQLVTDLNTPERTKAASIGTARALLDASIRRQCWGVGAIFSSPDDNEWPGIMNADRPW